MKQAGDTSHHILIIEDDADINDIVAAFLTKQGFSCTQAYSGSEARLILERMAERSQSFAQSPAQALTQPYTQAPAQATASFDLIITDLMLPGLSGNQLVNLIREKSDVPIIVTSAQDTPAEKLALFELGVDDYLVKPFDLDELLARISVQFRHVLRRPGSAASSPSSLSSSNSQSSPSSQLSSNSQSSSSLSSSADAAAPSAASLCFRDWQLNPESRQFSVAGSSIKLTRTEFNILEALVRRPSKVYTKQELFTLAWQEESFVEEKAINVHISNIRSKLKSSGTDSYIETVWGIGFKLAE